MCNSNTHLVIIQTFLAQIIYLMGIWKGLFEIERGEVNEEKS